MIKLYDKETGTFIGEISDSQLQILIDELEEEHKADTDYYINQAQLDIFEENGVDGELVGLLRKALGNRKDMEVVWSKQ